MRIRGEVANNLMAERLSVSPLGCGQVIGPSEGEMQLHMAQGKKQYLVCCDSIHKGLSYALTCDRTHHKVWEAPFYRHKQVQNRSLKWIV